MSYLRRLFSPPDSDSIPSCYLLERKLTSVFCEGLKEKHLGPCELHMAPSRSWSAAVACPFPFWSWHFALVQSYSPLQPMVRHCFVTKAGCSVRTSAVREPEPARIGPAAAAAPVPGRSAPRRCSVGCSPAPHAVLVTAAPAGRHTHGRVPLSAPATAAVAETFW